MCATFDMFFQSRSDESADEHTLWRVSLGCGTLGLLPHCRFRRFSSAISYDALIHQLCFTRCFPKGHVIWMKSC